MNEVTFPYSNLQGASIRVTVYDRDDDVFNPYQLIDSFSYDFNVPQGTPSKQITLTGNRLGNCPKSRYAQCVLNQYLTSGILVFEFSPSLMLTS